MRLRFRAAFFAKSDEHIVADQRNSRPSLSWILGISYSSFYVSCRY